MKHQQVSVDFWAVGKAMLTYGVLTALGWIMLRLFHSVFTLPRRLRAQQDNIKKSLKDLQERFPDLNITEEEMMNAEEELDKIVEEFEREEQERKEKEEKEKKDQKEIEGDETSSALEDVDEPNETETKKTI